MRIHPLPIALAILLASSQAIQAQLIAEESFLVGNGPGLYAVDTNIAAPNQPAPDPITGLIGWGSGNTHLDTVPKTGSLTFGAGDNQLAAKSGKLKAFTGGKHHIALMNTSADGPFAEYIDPSSLPLMVGSKDTGVLYMSGLVRIERTNAGQFYVCLGTADEAKTGKSAERKVSFGVLWNKSAYNHTSVQRDLETHLYVAKIEFKPGNDAYTVWFDPDLTKSEAQQTAAGSGTGELRFDCLVFNGQLVNQITLPDGTKTADPLFYTDEIRFGKTFYDVLPLAVLFTLTVEQDEHGSVTADPGAGKHQSGTEVKLTAEGSRGYRFKEWISGVPEADKTNAAPTIILEGNTTVQAAFEEIPSYAVTLTALPENGGTVEMDPPSPVQEGKEVTLIATPAEGFQFSEWTIGGQTYSSNPLTRSILAEETITANFVSTALSVDPTSAAFPASGGSASITVTTEVSWTATKDASWITITAGTSGTGNGSVDYTVAANTGDARTGKITINGAEVAINQSKPVAPPPVSIFTAPCSSDFGAGFKWNSPFGYFYDGFYPFVYSFDHSRWIYIYHSSGLTETAGYFLYDFAQSKFGWTGCEYYPTITYY